MCWRADRWLLGDSGGGLQQEMKARKRDEEDEVEEEEEDVSFDSDDFEDEDEDVSEARRGGAQGSRHSPPPLLARVQALR